jgi:hypothetical protein
VSRAHFHSNGFPVTFRHLAILVAYFAILFKVFIPLVENAGKLVQSAGIQTTTSIALAVLLISPPLLTLLVVVIERPGPLKNWAVSLLLCLFFPALVLNHDCRVLFAYLESGQRPTLWATLLVNALVLPHTLTFVRKMVPRPCPSCRWRTLVPLLRVFRKDKRTAKTCWCASCGAVFWKDLEGTWRPERRQTWLDESKEPPPAEKPAAQAGRPELLGTPHRSQGGRAETEVHSS